jgi:hypothetical protein
MEHHEGWQQWASWPEETPDGSSSENRSPQFGGKHAQQCAAVVWRPRLDPDAVFVVIRPVPALDDFDQPSLGQGQYSPRDACKFLPLVRRQSSGCR